MKEIELTLIGLLPSGEAFGYQEGEKILVFGGLPGEIVKIKIFNKQKSFYRGEIIEILKASPYRQNPNCQVFLNKGGCDFHHVKYEFQVLLKKEIIFNEFKEILKEEVLNKILKDVLVVSSPFYYRNRGDFWFDKKTQKIGIKSRWTKKFIPLESHCLVHQEINKILLLLQDQKPKKETHNVIIRYGLNTGDFLVYPEFHFDKIKTGQKFYYEKLFDKEFKISTSSFFQTNTLGAQEMVNLIKKFISPQEDKIIIDAYAGVGTFSYFLSKIGEKVIALEESYSAFLDAQENLKGLSNVDYLLGKVEELLPKININSPIDVIILDPPRSGCSIIVLEEIVKKRIKKIIYLSCDLLSLKRDLKYLIEKGYKLLEIQPIDLFPNTHHLEIFSFLAI